MDEARFDSEPGFSDRWLAVLSVHRKQARAGKPGQQQQPMSRNHSSGKKGIDPSNASAVERDADHEQALVRIKELERRLEALEGVFSDRVVEKQNSHVRAQEQDAGEKLAAGDITTVVVEEPPEANDGKAATHVDSIVTFVKDADGAEKGDVLEVRFTDVQPNYAHALAVE